MKYLFGLILMLSVSLAYSQQLQYEVNSASATVIQDNLIVNWSLGGIPYHQFCSDDVCLSGDWINDEIVYGLDEMFLNSYVQIFPNPLSDILYIDIDPQFSFPIYVSVFNVSGKMIIEQEIGTMNSNIDFAHLNSGFYLVEFIDGENHKEIFRIIKK